MARLRRPLLSLAALAAAILAFSGRAAPPTYAEDDDPQPSKSPPLEGRVYDVGALVQGFATFTNDRGPFGALEPDRVNDEASPLFAFEGEEILKPLGAVTDLIELVKTSTRPGSWDRWDVNIQEQGTRHVVVRGPATLQDQVSAVLAQFEREILTTVVVDVVACTGAAREGESLPEAVARGAVRPVAAARTSGFLNQAVIAFHGAQRALLVDQEVSVAKGAKESAPMIGVQDEGLAVRTTVTRVGEVIRLDLDAWLARVDGSIVRDVNGEKIETPSVDGRSTHSRVDTRPGAWTWAATAGDVSFAVRATIRPFDDPMAWSPSMRLDAPGASGGGGEIGPVSTRRFAIGDLADRVGNSRGQTIHLTPSNYTAPEAPELPEPWPVFPIDSLVEYVKATIDPPSWEREGTGIEVKQWMLLARSDESHLDAVGRFLDDLRARYLKTVRVRWRVVSVPAASIPDGWAGGAIDDAAALVALPGAEVLDRGSLRMLPGSRQASIGGVMRRYVGDYQVTLADEAAIGNPIVREVLDGLSLDVRVARVLGGGAYVVEARIDRSTWRGSRDVPTKHGALQCPTIGLMRFRGSVVAKAGETRVVAAGLDGSGGDEMLFVLLTLTEE